MKFSTILQIFILIFILNIGLSAYQGQWILDKIQGQAISIQKPVKYNISLQVINNYNGTNQKLVRNKLQISGCITFTYYFKTIGDTFYLDSSSYQFIKEKSTKCSSGQNKLMMLIYKNLKDVFKIIQSPDVIQLQGVQNRQIFSLKKQKTQKIQKKQEKVIPKPQQLKSLVGQWQVYKVNKQDTGLRFLVNITPQNIQLCNNKINISYSIKSSGQCLMNINQQNYEVNKKQCSNNESNLIAALKDVKFYRTMGKFSALFNQNNSPLVQLKDITPPPEAQKQTLPEQKKQTKIEQPKKELKNQQIVQIINTVKGQAQQIKNEVTKKIDNAIAQSKIVETKQVKKPIQTQDKPNGAQIEQIKQIISGKWTPKTIFKIPPPSSSVFILISSSQIIINGCNIHIFPYSITKLNSNNKYQFDLQFGVPRSTLKACAVDDDSFYLRAIKIVVSGYYDPTNQALKLLDKTGKDAYLLKKFIQDKKQEQKPKPVLPKVQQKALQIIKPKEQVNIQVKKNETKAPEIKQTIEKVENKVNQNSLPIGTFISMLLKNRSSPRIYIQLNSNNQIVIKGDCTQYNSSIKSLNGQKIQIKENSKKKNECQVQNEYMNNLNQCHQFEYNKDDRIMYLKNEKGDKLIWMKQLTN